MTRWAKCDWCSAEINLSNDWNRSERDKWIVNNDGDFCDAVCAQYYAAKYHPERAEAKPSPKRGDWPKMGPKEWGFVSSPIGGFLRYK